MARSDDLGWRGTLAVVLVVPIGVACAVATLLAQLLEPHWNMGGQTFVSGYPKSVELTAVLSGIGVGAASALLARWRLAYAAAWSVALIGFGAAWYVWRPTPTPWLPGLALAVLAALGLARALQSGSHPSIVAGGGATIAWTALLTALTVLLATSPMLIDVYHDGSALLSARDLARGGRPFHTFIWAHGLQDTGVAALWIRLTGTIGSAPLALMIATSGALALPTLVLVGRGAAGSWRAALCAAAVAVAVTVALTLPPLGDSGVLVYILRSVGFLVFVAAGFAAADAEPRGRYALAGAAIAVAHLFRFELGAHGLLAVGAVVVYRTAFAESARGLGLAAGAVGRLALGIGVTLLACRLLLGWPDGAWYANTFGFLTSYHTAYNGHPFPWPRGAVVGWAREWVWGGGVLLLTIALLSSGARAAIATRWPAAGAAAPDSRRTRLLVFAAMLAAAAMRTALDRSDALHLVMWMFVPLYATALLLGADRLPLLIRTPRRQAALLTVVAALLTARVVALDSPRQLLALLRPNPPQGACADTLLTPREAQMRINWSLIEDSCMAEQVLRANRVEHLLIDHSAAWYYARFDLALPSQHYMLNQAVPPADQLALIERWRQRPLQALLQARGYAALERYDVHNAFQVPVLEAYLRARRAAARAQPTPIGMLWLLDQPPLPPAAPVTGAADAALDLRVNELLLDPATGFVTIQGWAADTRSGAAVPRFALLRDGVIDPTAEQVTPIPRPDVAAFFNDRRHADAGWMLVTRLADPTALPTLRVRAEAADGRHAEVDVPAELLRALPPRDGDEWRDLPAAVAAAERLGQADAAQPTP